MKAKKKEPIKCPECEKTYSTAKGLSGHRRFAHGVEGSSYSALLAKKRKSALQCPECSMTFSSAGILAMHRAKKHGVAGQGRTALYAHLREQAAQGLLVKTIDPNNPLQCQKCGYPAKSKNGLGVHLGATHKLTLAENVSVPATEIATTTQPPTSNGKRKYTRRAIEPAQSQAIVLSYASNGHHHPTQEAHPAPDGIPEATLALALGRFQELCRSIAFEHDLPPRLFTSRLAGLVYATSVR